MIGKYGTNEINKLFNVSTQMLCAYKLKFNFNSDSGILNYLNTQEFQIDNPFEKVPKGTENNGN